MSKLVFRSSLGPWGAWSCACGCSDACVIWEAQEVECVGQPRYYVRNHQPLACDPARVGEKWDPEYDPSLDFERASEVVADVEGEWLSGEPTLFEDEETPTIEWETDTSGSDGLEFGDPRSFFDDNYDTKP